MTSRPGSQFFEAIRNDEALIRLIDSDSSLEGEITKTLAEFEAALLELYPQGRLHVGACSAIKVKDLPDVGMIAVCHARFNSDDMNYSIEVGAYKATVPRNNPFRGEAGFGVKFTVNPVN